MATPDPTRGKCKDCRAVDDAYNDWCGSGQPDCYPNCPGCDDCVWPGEKPPLTPRPAHHPGPRCATHHRAAMKAQKARTAERRNINTYGLGEGDYDRLYAFQGGRCAICRTATGKVRRLAVDHRHSDGFVRGLLCKSCNRIVGFARDNPDWFTRAARYLQNPPAFTINIIAKHVDNRQTAIDPPHAPGGLQPWPFIQPDLPAVTKPHQPRKVTQ